MPTPLLRKKKTDTVETLDPVSAATWAAGAKATGHLLDLLGLLKISHDHAKLGATLRQQLREAAALTPCAIHRDARVLPARRWSFQDYLLTVRVCEALRDIVVDGVASVPTGTFEPFDSTREKAANAVVAFIEQIEAYAKLVKRERAYERLSGQKSLRRGLL